MESLLYLYGVGFFIWIYSFISVLSNEFKSGTTKIVWILALIFFPVSCLIYPFLKNKQIVGSSSSFIAWEDIIMWASMLIGIFIGIFIASFIFVKITNFYNIDLNHFVGGIIIAILGLIFGFIIFLGFAAIHGLFQAIVNKNKNEKEIIKNAKNGIAADQNRLGVMYENGRYVKKDLHQAVNWYEKAAEQNNAWGLYNLGECYYSGKYFNQDYIMARELYEKAAKQNHSEAQNKLGIIYNNGYGIDMDEVEALKWFEKAANNGFHWAQSNLANMYYNGEGTEKNYQKAYELYKKASEQNNEVAMVKLAKMYLLGQGVSENFEYAKELLSNLYKKGNEDAVFLWQSYNLENI